MKICRIDPALKFYSGIPLMINHNRDLVKTGRVNGTLCRGHSLKMKHNCNLRWKNWMEKSHNSFSEKY